MADVIAVQMQIGVESYRRAAITLKTGRTIETAMLLDRINEAFSDASKRNDRWAERIAEVIAACVREAEGESGAWDIIQGELEELGYRLEATPLPTNGPCDCAECVAARNAVL